MSPKLCRTTGLWGLFFKFNKSFPIFPKKRNLLLSNQAELLDSIGKVIVFLMIFFAVYLFTVKSQKKLPNVIFATFLLITAFDLSGLFLVNFYRQYLVLLNIKTASSLLQMPLWYFYVRSVCFSDFSFKWKDTLHVLPFLLFIAVFRFHLFLDFQYTSFEFFGEVQYVAYMVAIFTILRKHKKVYLQNYANPDYTAHKWLFQATVMFCIAHVLVVLRWLSGYFDTSSTWAPLVNILITISAFAVTCWLVMRAMHKPQLFMGVETELMPVKKKKGQEKTLETLESIEKLKEYMLSDKPYLDYDLSLEKLASQIGIEEKELSQLINFHLDKHFFDFINEYRIKDATSILKNPEYTKLTVLEILYQVGFNSKSSFYTAFKKETGQTPLNYRKSAL